MDSIWYMTTRQPSGWSSYIDLFSKTPPNPNPPDDDLSHTSEDLAQANQQNTRGKTNASTPLNSFRFIHASNSTRNRRCNNQLYDFHGILLIVGVEMINVSIKLRHLC